MSSKRVNVNPKLLVWARDRAGLDVSVLEHRFSRLAEWEAGKIGPTLRQLEEFARAVHVPIGYLFLERPMEEPIPLPDFRTVPGVAALRPSPNLLDTIYLCQRRQDWFREHVQEDRQPRLDFIGSAAVDDDPVPVAESIRGRLSLSPAERGKLPSWSEALRQLIAGAENAGILVMASSVVGSNNHRRLEVNEFRGFALADDLAPLVFVNGSDSRAAQMFTLAHELAHLWLGKSGISNTEAGHLPDRSIERWCNEVAAEMLVPMHEFQRARQPHLNLAEEIQLLARKFKVSTLVVLRRLFDSGYIDNATLSRSYREEYKRIREFDQTRSGGGNFYHTFGVRTGKRFARAVLVSTLEGRTLFRDAFLLLGVKKSATIREAAHRLGVLP